jgi:hypothetical protein
VAFTGDVELPAGQPIELWVKWPVETEQHQHIELHISGHIVRTEKTKVGLKIWRYAFVAVNHKPEAEPAGERTVAVGQTPPAMLPETPQEPED